MAARTWPSVGAASSLLSSALAPLALLKPRGNFAVHATHGGRQMHVVGPGVAAAERGRDFGLDTHALTRAPGRWCSKVR